MTTTKSRSELDRIAESNRNSLYGDPGGPGSATVSPAALARVTRQDPVRALEVLLDMARRGEVSIRGLETYIMPSDRQVTAVSMFVRKDRNTYRYKPPKLDLSSVGELDGRVSDLTENQIEPTTFGEEWAKAVVERASWGPARETRQAEEQPRRVDPPSASSASSASPAPAKPKPFGAREIDMGD